VLVQSETAQNAGDIIVVSLSLVLWLGSC